MTEPSPAGLIADTSPLLFFHRSGAMDLLSAVSSNRLAEGDRSSGSVWVPQAVHTEIAEGERSGYDMPDLGALPWVGTAPAPAAPPSEWLALDLGPGELAAMSLALEHTERAVLLDDRLARRVAKAAGLTVWGTLGILLEAKRGGHVERIAPVVDRMDEAGMWLSDEVRERILRLADEA